MSTLYVDNLQPNLGSGVLIPGHVVQVVQATTSTDTAVTSSTYVDAGLSATITPSSTSSKVLVLWSQSTNVVRAAANNGGCGIQLLRGATSIQNYGNGTTNPFVSLYMTDSGSTTLSLMSRITGEYLDSPSTTSATTYKLQMAVGASGTTATAQVASTPSIMTLMEIAQ